VSVANIYNINKPYIHFQHIYIYLNEGAKDFSVSLTVCECSKYTIYMGYTYTCNTYTYTLVPRIFAVYVNVSATNIKYKHIICIRATHIRVLV